MITAVLGGGNGAEGGMGGGDEGRAKGGIGGGGAEGGMGVRRTRWMSESGGAGEGMTRLSAHFYHHGYYKYTVTTVVTMVTARLS